MSSGGSAARQRQRNALRTEAAAAAKQAAPVESDLSEYSIALTKAAKSASFEGLRIVVVGMVLFGLISITRINPGSANPTTWYSFAGVDSNDAFTWVGVLLAGVIALNVAIALLPRPGTGAIPELKAVPELVAAQWIWTSVLNYVVRLGAVGSLGVAGAQFVPGEAVSAPPAKIVVCIMALTAVLVASTVAPLAKSRERAAVDKFRAINTKKRIVAAMQHLRDELTAKRRNFDMTGREQVGKRDMGPRAARWSVYAGWVVIPGLLSMVGWALPDALHYGRDYFDEWQSGIPYYIAFVLITGSIALGLVWLGGVGLSMRWRWPNKKFWTPLVLATLSAFAIIWVVLAWTEARSVRSIWANELLILPVIVIPVIAMWIVFFWWWGPALVVVRSIHAKWSGEVAALDKQIKRLQELAGERVDAKAETTA